MGVGGLILGACFDLSSRGERDSTQKTIFVCMLV